ncbi:prepilin-type N-terminal cleavage/methylation domain-containing protein [Blastopirellula sp. J2-11]|uniref:type IV pilus modification PilV family protein n=1 Tax=Blastopirellula sp. J2-11 TaxID=2943192 RepID=UPI0021C61392|nr:prepilin-type N-terminal cleavage/methylation domain-containing protein [Blastopirellula sp. J2-11]UUO05257.1 prepilin-type N-terminal cleavage/methylation domain-containing protein [Blastopirellula sp. J2-11]
MQPTRNRRRGITLVEVLMSTMVVMLGILGLISLIPLGSHLAERGTRSDRVASIGRRVQREAKVYGMMNPDSWLDPLKSPTPVDQTRFRTSASSLPVRQSYLIDPMFFIDSATQRQFFPYDTTATPQMRRLSLGSYNASFPFMESRAERAFVSDDDYGVGTAGGYERPKDREEPLLQKFFTRGGTNIRRQSQGTYSWAIMLVPEASSTRVNTSTGGNMPPFATAAAGSTTGNSQPPTDQYVMSTIIFQNRQGDIPTSADIAGATERGLLNERVLTVETGSFISGGGTTGEIQLTAGTPELLDMKTGDWICLTVRVTRTIGSNMYYWGDNFKWYRVVAMDEIEEVTVGSKYDLRLTLDGPDWNAMDPPTQAIYVEDVVGVYERKVRLETGSPWTP